jgi:hypothetical protein
VTPPREVDPQLARQLVLDELFDLSLYESLRDVATGDLRSILDQLIPIEARHLAFWQDFFDLPVRRLDWWRRVKLAVMVAVCRLLGAPAIHLVLEGIEVKRRVLTNLVIIAAAVGITFAIGVISKRVWGVSV